MISQALWKLLKTFWIFNLWESIERDTAAAISERLTDCHLNREYEHLRSARKSNEYRNYFYSLL
jgi:hypothetical protein